LCIPNGRILERVDRFSKGCYRISPFGHRQNVGSDVGVSQINRRSSFAVRRRKGSVVRRHCRSRHDLIFMWKSMSLKSMSVVYVGQLCVTALHRISTQMTLRQREGKNKMIEKNINPSTHHHHQVKFFCKSIRWGGGTVCSPDSLFQSEESHRN
jgi:hypothetical protein